MNGSVQRLASKGWKDQSQWNISWYVSFTRRTDLRGLCSAAGLGAGATEAILVVSPMEVVKIRLQAQQRESATHPHLLKQPFC